MQPTQIVEPTDALAYIGVNPGFHENVYIATGDSGQGLTHGTIAAMLIPDLIQGRYNEWETLYNPSRKSLRMLPGTLKHDVEINLQYKDYVTAGDVASVDDIPPGSGAVIRAGLNKHAVYKDEQGKVYEMSAVCTHLGGIVHWNAAEKSWDCPVHGSRFSCKGEVINGPAVRNLKLISHDAHLGEAEADQPLKS